MPRYFYISVAILSIPLAQALRFGLQNNKIRLLFIVFIIAAGIFSVRRQASVIQPYTDDLRFRLAVFRTTGYLPPKPGRGFKLDWSFEERTACAYFRLGGKSLLSHGITPPFCSY